MNAKYRQKAPSVSVMSVNMRLDDSLLIDQFHRSLQPVPKPGQHSRSIITRPHYCSDCAKILNLAKEKQ